MDTEIKFMMVSFTPLTLAVTPMECMYTHLEPPNLFHVHDDNNNKRPDLLLINPPGFNKERVAIDVSMHTAFPRTSISLYHSISK